MTASTEKEALVPIDERGDHILNELRAAQVAMASNSGQSLNEIHMAVLALLRFAINERENRGDGGNF